MKATFVLVVLALALGSEAAVPKIYAPRLRQRIPSARIVGGEEAVPHSAPYQGGLHLYAEDGTYFCGAVLFHPRAALTAAHCGELTNNITLVLGAHNIKDNNEATQVKRQIDQVIIHPEWDSEILSNDITILIWKEPVELNENIALVKLPQQGEDFANNTGRTTGWGKDSDDATTIATNLREVKVPIINNDQCVEEFSWWAVLLPELLPSHLCTSGLDGKGSCNGDSGGPTVVIEKDNVLAGLVSWGLAIGCEYGYPSVFTRVSYFRDWIDQNTPK